MEISGEERILDLDESCLINAAREIKMVIKFRPILEVVKNETLLFLINCSNRPIISIKLELLDKNETMIFNMIIWNRSTFFNCVKVGFGVVL